MTAHTPPEGTKPYEERDVAMRPIVVTALALLLVLVATFVIVRLLDTTLRTREAAHSDPVSPLASYGRSEPPEPRLQHDPRGDLATLRAREDELLRTYGWVDRPAGRVRIPVERAMALLEDKGAR